MTFGRLAAAASVLVLLAPTSGSTQTAPISQVVPITFTGVVTQSAADTIMVRQPGFPLTPYTGVLPPLSYAVGDAVSISFNATLPTRAYYDAYTSQLGADGIARIPLFGAYYGGGSGPGGIGLSSIADVSGPMNPFFNGGQPTSTRMTIVYDYNADSYSIEGSGNFQSSWYSAPGYIYNAATQSYDVCNGGNSCAGAGGAPDPVDIALRSNADGTSVFTSPIAIRSTDPSSGTGTGFFSWAFGGSWNLPQFGGATQVPEPGMLVLFGGACAALVRRRKRVAA